MPFDLRARLGAMVFERVAGPDGPQHRDRIHNADGERWFDDDRPIRQVHADTSMFVGGLRALLLQSLHPPRTEAELAARLAAYRPELRSTAEARAAARFLLVRPPLPAIARPPYAVLASAAVASLPVWARWPLRLPYLPLAEATLVRGAGTGIVRALRWATTPPPGTAA